MDGSSASLIWLTRRASSNDCNPPEDYYCCPRNKTLACPRGAYCTTTGCIYDALPVTLGGAIGWSMCCTVFAILLATFIFCGVRRHARKRRRALLDHHEGQEIGLVELSTTARAAGNPIAVTGSSEASTFAATSAPSTPDMRPLAPDYASLPSISALPSTIDLDDDPTRPFAVSTSSGSVDPDAFGQSFFTSKEQRDGSIPPAPPPKSPGPADPIDTSDGTKLVKTSKLTAAAESPGIPDEETPGVGSVSHSDNPMTWPAVRVVAWLVSSGVNPDIVQKFAGWCAFGFVVFSPGKK
ncbi:hypothetical protein HDU96_006456 [Phlyctochytrium bullatum]|nr:hypothetical protein HDU96_006456 [Phlyctochytrium bullatum]